MVEAYKTIYVPVETWEYIQNMNLSLKNRYSYAYHEYQVKDRIPVDMIMAVGIPYFDILLHQGRENVWALTSSIHNLLTHYEVSIPIVDINCYNQVVKPPEKQNVFQKK